MNTETQELVEEIDEATQYYQAEILPRMKTTAELIKTLVGNPSKLNGIKGKLRMKKTKALKNDADLQDPQQLDAYLLQMYRETNMGKDDTD